MALKAPTSGIAAAIGKHFGWEPKRSSLSSQMQNTASAAFSRPGDLIKDFWAWAELPLDGSISRSSSLGSSSTYPPPKLMSTNSDEKNMSLYFSEDEDEDWQKTDDESLIMIFQWHDHAAADRFKHPLQKSYGPNGEAIRNDLWDEHVARPITSLHGKKLDQLYPKSNEFHTSRRSWYLPISPSPEHPDAHSKKAKKRFPTLALADGATLRWDSYVNIRHVYKIDWTLLKPYANLNDPRMSHFRLDWESTVRMIAKGKILTLYEPGPQVPVPEVQKARTAPALTSTESASYVVRDMRRLSSSESDAAKVEKRANNKVAADSRKSFPPANSKCSMVLIRNGLRQSITDEDPERLIFGPYFVGVLQDLIHDYITLFDRIESCEQEEEERPA
ncbi:hypothetical protein N0V95_003562 [Ascochyta clinopodiicola]|nr:hypothetical protein N0V95_003562 [Ascochyta clinopodiicola]